METTNVLTGFARTTFANKVWELFGNKLMATHHFSATDAQLEVKRMKAEMEKKNLIFRPESITKNDFFKYSRIGLFKAIDRRERLSMYLTFERCLSHVSTATMARLEAS
ncbi:hypothetical protein OCT63_19750 [Vibrio sp. RW]|uniref:hypothetical protein n=1 Tax=Vibrio sp. RW TaxID=2998833 RepID=UPI0022CD5116|nr:hypothetical protein [Vibrio sp. RW]MDA0146464.1 hypothetical protein [Vibrio sp. RW]